MTFVKFVLFSVGLMLAVTWLTNVLPQMQSNPPEDEVPIVAGEIDMLGMIVLGEKLFSGKGTCTLCHNSLGRAPDLLALDLNATFKERLADDHYEGEGKGLEIGEAFAAYILESMTDPSAYVVPGFGKKGSKDTVSPMPKISGPPISLSDIEMNAVTAFLQDLGGVDPTVDLPSADEDVLADDEDEDTAEPAESGEDAIDKYGCSACHDLNDSESEIGPKLNGIGKRMTREQLRIAILDPNDTIAEGFDEDMMPAEFGEEMFVIELEMIIDHLMELEE
ncbi:MAG: cytochrome C [Rhodospirillaceae bacterium]|nr:MAG: cytochrome C [Rhodospirillaceae bacterium]